MGSVAGANVVDSVVAIDSPVVGVPAADSPVVGGAVSVVGVAVAVVSGRKGTGTEEHKYNV